MTHEDYMKFSHSVAKEALPERYHSWLYTYDLLELEDHGGRADKNRDHEAHKPENIYCLAKLAVDSCYSMCASGTTSSSSSLT